jgi:hypothetical protein
MIQNLGEVPLEKRKQKIKEEIAFSFECRN